MSETVEVDKEYLWALEVLALDYLKNKSSYNEYSDAKDVVQSANFNQPREKTSTTQRGTGGSIEGQKNR